ncbi:hypothetical protein FKP32DRAFT_1660817 [Trametes sanguinea]|nr:hypothetical protein FKP32DRAFT_1660817 [Trametes sanguinea]
MSPPALFYIALYLLLRARTTTAVPVYDGAVLGSSAPFSVTPLTAALTLLPLPLLGALKFAYVRFRRAQSIHTHPHTLSPNLDKTMPPRSSVARLSAERLEEQRSPARLWSSATPYLVGFLGSPEWETKICSRLDRTIRQAKVESRRSSCHPTSPRSFAFADSSGTTANTSTAYYSSLSTKSRSKSLSASFGDTSASASYRLPGAYTTSSHVFSAITDCAAIHPSSPPCMHAFSLPQPPEPAHKASKVPMNEHSPTLMQMMEPVLASWYEDSKSAIPSTSANTSRDKSATSAEPTSPSYQTPMTSPASPAMIGAYPESRSSRPFAALRKHLGVSATSSVLSVSATTIPSPASVSLAVFRSPTAPSISMPEVVYTPAIRPESCAVLPVNWRSPSVAGDHSECLNVHALLQSPTHRSPAPGYSAGMFDVLVSPSVSVRPVKSPKVSFSPTLDSTMPSSPVSPHNATVGPVILRSALKKRSSAGGSTSPAIPSSLRNSVSFSMISLEVPGGSIAIGDTSVASLLSVCSAARSNTEVKNRKSWDLTDLMNNGQLDVDAVTHVLGLGLGMPPVSRSSVGSMGSDTPSAALSISIMSPNAADSAARHESEAGPANAEDNSAEYDVEQYANGWGSPRMDEMRASIQLLTHVHGAPLCVIAEETMSDVRSVAGSVHVPPRPGSLDEEGLISMELVSAIVEAEDGGVNDSLRVDEDSWREGESLLTLNVGVAW